MSKKKHSPEWMLARIEEYLSGEGSYETIARANEINEWTLRQWVKKYLEYGAEAFVVRTGNAYYSKEFKRRCVEAVICGEGNVDDIVARNNISSKSVLQSWIKLYNANVELKDYDPKPTVRYIPG